MILCFVLQFFQVSFYVIVASLFLCLPACNIVGAFGIRMANLTFLSLSFVQGRQVVDIDHPEGPFGTKVSVISIFVQRSNYGFIVVCQPLIFEV